MFEDPIVNEIRKNREKIAAEHQYDTHRLFQFWRNMEKKHKERLVKSIKDADLMADVNREKNPS